MSLWKRFFGCRSKSSDSAKANHSATATPGLSERDNVGTRYETQARVRNFWAPYTFGRPSFPFIFYSMRTKNDAVDAMLALSPIKLASDSGKLISTEVLQFGVYPCESDGQITSWGFFLAGEQLTLELYDAAIASCTKYNGTNPRVSDPPEAPAPLVTPVAAKPDLDSVLFDREEEINTLDHLKALGMEFSGSGSPVAQIATKRHYKALDKDAALAFLKSTPVDKPLFYIIVHTPDGDVGRDKDGIF